MKFVTASHHYLLCLSEAELKKYNILTFSFFFETIVRMRLNFSTNPKRAM